MHALSATVIAQAENGETELPVDVWHWSLVFLPIAVLLFLYTVRRWKGPEAGPIAVILAAIIAVSFFKTPLDTLAVAAGKGVWDSLPILFVIFAALLLYRIGTAAGAFHALRHGVEKHTKNRVFLVLAFGWVFASFTQGIAGFGAPIVIVAPILLALGVKPVYAVVIPLIGHAWAKFFGTLGVGWLATVQVVDIEDEVLTALLTSLLLLIPIGLAGVGIAWMMGKMRAVKHALPFILIQTAIIGGGQIGFVFVSPELSSFLATSLGMIALLPLARWSRYSKDPEIENMSAMEENGEQSKSDNPEEAQEDKEPSTPIMGLGWALAPYGILTVISVVVLAIGPVQSFLESFSFGPSFPEVTTGYGITNDAEDAYEPFAILAHPSGLLLFAALGAWILYAARGYFSKWREQADPPPIWSSALSEATPASAAVVTFLVLASIFSHSGQVDVLALGVAAVSAPPVYAVAATFIGIIGTLVTSSSTSSNILFAPMQDAVATNQELPQSAILAAQSVGGAIGNVIAPVNVVLGTTAVGASGQEGIVIRKALIWLLPVAVLTGLATLLMI